MQNNYEKIDKSQSSADVCSGEPTREDHSDTELDSARWIL